MVFRRDGFMAHVSLSGDATRPFPIELTQDSPEALSPSSTTSPEQAAHDACEMTFGATRGRDEWAAAQERLDKRVWEGEPRWTW